jgi:hypothetical protein
MTASFKTTIRSVSHELRQLVEERERSRFAVDEQLCISRYGVLTVTVCAD